MPEFLWLVAARFDRMLTSVIKGSYPAPWVEDDITYSILKEWRRDFGSIELHDFNNAIRVRCSGYKFRGAPETRYGDIALQFAINFADGSSTSGYGFLEAKRRGRKSVEFPALDIDQLKRITTSAPYAQLLLYDFDPITSYRPGNYPLSRHFHHEYYDYLLTGSTPFTHAVSLPISTALGTNDHTTSLYKQSAPLFEQIWFRYLYGLDLHYGTPYSKAVEQFDIAQGSPNFVMVISVAHGNAAVPEQAGPPDDFYSAIE